MNDVNYPYEPSVTKAITMWMEDDTDIYLHILVTEFGRFYRHTIGGIFPVSSLGSPDLST